MLTFEQFLRRQPSYPAEQPTDKYYYDLCLQLDKAWSESGLMKNVSEALRSQVVLCLVGYYQDVSSDAGIWHAFIDEHRRLYGRTLPFYDCGDDYVDYELNYPDIRFLLWYALAMTDEDFHLLNPLSVELEQLSRLLFDKMEGVYDTSPLPEGYRLCHEWEMHAAEDREAIMDFSVWLYSNCYLMTPAFTSTLVEILSDPEVRADKDYKVLNKRLEEAMSSIPTGPLALYLIEWTHLIVEHRYPKQRAEIKSDHPLWQRFTDHTGGEEIKIFSSYADMNRFFIEALGWAEGEEHLVQMKDANDFVLMVNRKRGLLVARNVARNIAMPGNVLYDKQFAEKNAIRMLTQRGYCPSDLTKYCCNHGWLPDASFPEGPDSHKAVSDNADFIGRCYLQLYYRD